MRINLSKYRQILITTALLSLIGIAVIYFFDFGIGKIICSNLDRACINAVDGGLFDAFYLGFFLKSIILSSLLLLLFPERVYKAWRWFAFIAIPLALIGIIFPIQEQGGQYFGKKETSDLFGWFFLIVTILIALIVTSIDWFKKRRSTLKNPSQ